MYSSYLIFTWDWLLEKWKVGGLDILLFTTRLVGWSQALWRVPDCFRNWTLVVSSVHPMHTEAQAEYPVLSSQSWQGFGIFFEQFPKVYSQIPIPHSNGKAFKSAALVVNQILATPEFQIYFEILRMSRIFDLERAPWRGGIFVSLIISIKKSLA